MIYIDIVDKYNFENICCLEYLKKAIRFIKLSKLNNKCILVNIDNLIDKNGHIVSGLVLSIYNFICKNLFCEKIIVLYSTNGISDELIKNITSNIKADILIINKSDSLPYFTNIRDETIVDGGLEISQIIDITNLPQVLSLVNIKYIDTVLDVDFNELESAVCNSKKCIFISRSLYDQISKVYSDKNYFICREFIDDSFNVLCVDLHDINGGYINHCDYVDSSKYFAQIFNKVYEIKNKSIKYILAQHIVSMY